MLLQRLLLAIGGIALLAGIVLAVIWLRSGGPSAPTPEQPKTAQAGVLVAARPLAARTLLRADDIRWQDMALDKAPQGSLARGQANEADFVGAAVSRSYDTGEPLTLGTLIKPTDPGFLPAVLGPGMRAVSIAVGGAAEGGAGLVAPGDHVDLLLTQSFTEASLARGSRSVAETVLQNLRVIAIDQTVGDIAKTKNQEAKGGASDPHVSKTVTLEVTPRQAEELMVAVQLGKVELSLRSLDSGVQATPPATAGATQPAAAEAGTGLPPTWAYEVSPALKAFGQESAKQNAPAATGGGEGPKAAHVVEIMRGTKSELRCFDAHNVTIPNCGLPEAAQAEAQAAPAAAAPAPAPAPAPAAAPAAATRGQAPKR
ncbi:MAG TPA: Flp pilus assembly protein CpaB [Alphaproteobacteria bacterium]|nr:Flp pilus assembly protein CpaB [Alphaproteobacteria bacterium]